MGVHAMLIALQTLLLLGVAQRNRGAPAIGESAQTLVMPPPAFQLPPSVLSTDDGAYHFSSGGCANGAPAGMHPSAHSNAAGKRRMLEPDARKEQRTTKEARCELVVADERAPQLEASLALARRAP